MFTAILLTAGLLVDFKDDATQAQRSEAEAIIQAQLTPNSIHALEEQFYVARVDNMTKAIQALEGLPYIEHVEPNYLYRILDDSPSSSTSPTSPPALPPGPPNDPLFLQQWNMEMIQAPSAWAYGTGSGVTVAVIDTGVKQDLEDLSYTAFSKGYDFVNDDNDPTDDHGHGTHVAGTIAQSTNNGKGVAGVAPRARIMPLKVLSSQGSGTTADISDAIRYAADEGAHILNLSLGGGPRSTVMEDAVSYARRKGVLVVCAAGNTGDGVVEYPAAYPGATAISSVGPTRQLAPYSSYGKQIKLAAPGGDTSQSKSGGILQNTLNENDPSDLAHYPSYQGTSMATPHVAGVAALVRSVNPRLHADQIEEILIHSATTDTGWTPEYGHGILDAKAAVKLAREDRSNCTNCTTIDLVYMAFAAIALLMSKLKILQPLLRELGAIAFLLVQLVLAIIRGRR